MQFAVYCILHITFAVAMDPVVFQDGSEDSITVVPKEETGPHTPQEMVTGRYLDVQQQDSGHMSQEEQGPHLPEELIT